MKTTKFNFLFLSLLLFCSVSLSAQVVVLSNLDEIDSTDPKTVGDPTGAGFANVIIAQEFVTGSLAYTNEPITVVLDVFSQGGSPTFQVDVFNKSGANPGASIATLAGDNMPAAGDATYTGTITLAAGTSYYIVVSAPNSTIYQLDFINSGNIDNALGFTAPNQIQTSSAAGAPAWGAPIGTGRMNFSLQLDSALPVELLGFKGASKEKVNVLEWATVSEASNDYFEIQHSVDGENFDALGTEDGRGTSNSLTNYRFHHENPSAGVHYYRLKQVDFEAQFAYSEIISVEVKGEEDQLAIYPNPARDQITILNGQGTAFISNMLGQSVQQLSIEDTQKTIQIDGLQQGRYILQILQADGKSVRKVFVKE